MTSPQQLAQALPLERLYVIHRDSKNYQSKWTKEKLIEAVFAPGNELTFTTLQYLNRTISVLGASTYLAGEANENPTYKKIGGTVAVASLYIEFLASYGKEKLFKTGERQEKWIELNKDTENLYISYQELAEILKPIRTNSLGKIEEVLKSLAKVTNELEEKDKEGNSKEAFLLKVWNDDSLSIRRITRWIINLPKILTLRPLTEVSLKSEWWLKEWEIRSSKREEVKDLIEILQEAISEYRQGVTEKEVEEKVERKLNDMLLESTLEIRKEVEDSQTQNQIEVITY